MDADQGLQASLEVAPKKRVKRVYTWKCAYCDEEFETENYSQRYCKRSHKQRAYELRQVEREERAVEADTA